MATRKFANDDGNLNTGAIITSRSRKYIDLDLAFENNSATGDIFKHRDAKAVKEAVKNLILTDYFERPYQPFLGSGVKGLLFELADDATSVEVKENIKAAITNYEPRAKILNISVIASNDDNALEATLEFQVVSTQETVALNLTLDRLR